MHVHQRSSGVFENTLRNNFPFFKKILHEKVFNFRCSPSSSFHPLPLKAFRKSFSPLGTQSCMPSMISFRVRLLQLVKLHFPSTLWQITKSIIRPLQCREFVWLESKRHKYSFPVATGERNQVPHVNARILCSWKEFKLNYCRHGCAVIEK